MSAPSKQVIMRAKEKGWEHLDGPYFRKAGNYYMYDPQGEMMVIVSKEEFEEYLAEKEKVEREAVKEAVQEARKEEVTKRSTRKRESKAEEARAEVLGPMDETMLAQIEMADERQIVEEMQGRVLQEYFYSFKAGDREIIGLSYAGVKQIAREMARRQEPIDIEDLEIKEDEESIQVVAKAVNMVTKEHRFGASRQPKVMTLRDGSEKEDHYALQKAISKATRNALRAFIPEEIIVEIYKEWRKQREERERFLGG